MPERPLGLMLNLGYWHGNLSSFLEQTRSFLAARTIPGAKQHHHQNAPVRPVSIYPAPRPAHLPAAGPSRSDTACATYPTAVDPSITTDVTAWPLMSPMATSQPSCLSSRTSLSLLRCKLLISMRWSAGHFWTCANQKCKSALGAHIDREGRRASEQNPSPGKALLECNQPYGFSLKMPHKINQLHLLARSGQLNNTPFIFILPPSLSPSLFPPLLLLWCCFGQLRGST